MAMRKMQEVLRENAALKAEIESLRLSLKRATFSSFELEDTRRILAQTIEHLARADNKLIRMSRSNTQLRNEVKSLQSQNNGLQDRLSKVIILEVLGKTG